MSPAQVASALATRKTVRITYHRGSDTHSVEVVLGGTVLDTIRTGVIIEDLAEHYAADVAFGLGLPIARVDVP
jgi:hypothetical protein